MGLSCNRPFPGRAIGAAGLGGIIIASLLFSSCAISRPRVIPLPKELQRKEEKPQVYIDQQRGTVFAEVIEEYEGAYYNNIDNILIYSPKTGQKKFLFEPGQLHSYEIIRELIFELRYDGVKRRIVFNHDRIEKVDSHFVQVHGRHVAFNENMVNRAISSSIAIVTYDLENEVRYIWLAQKDGSGLKRAALLEKLDLWHIDPLNRKVRVIRQAGLKTQFREFDW